MNKICGPAVLAVSLFAVAAAIPDAAHACNVQLGSPNSCSQYCDGDLIDGPEIISCETYVRRKRDQRGPALPPRAAEGGAGGHQTDGLYRVRLARGVGPREDRDPRVGFDGP